MEQLLSASPAARQLMDELRALSSTLQSLPQEKGRRRPQSAGVANGRAADADGNRARRRRRGAGHAIVAADAARNAQRPGAGLVGLAVAIGLMIAFLEPNKPQKGVQQGQQIALPPPKPENATSAPAEKRSHELTIQAAPPSRRRQPPGSTALPRRSYRRQWRPRVASQERPTKWPKSRPWRSVVLWPTKTSQRS